MVALDKYVEHFSTAPLQQYTRQGTSNLAKSACQEVARLVTYAHTTDNQICRQLTPCPSFFFVSKNSIIESFGFMNILFFEFL